MTGVCDTEDMRSVWVAAAMCLALAGCGEDEADDATGRTTGPTTDRGTPTREPSASPASTFTVSGFVTANGTFGIACRGTGRSVDLHSGAPVEVLGAEGAVIASGALGEGFADDDSPQRRCIFPFTVRKVPEGRGPFAVQVARRTAVPFTREHAGQVTVTLP